MTCMIVDCMIINISNYTRSCPARAGAEVSKKGMAVGNQWPIGKFLRCRSNEVLKL